SLPSAFFPRLPIHRTVAIGGELPIHSGGALPGFNPLSLFPFRGPKKTKGKKNPQTPPGLFSFPYFFFCSFSPHARSVRVVKLDSFLGAYTLAIGVFDRSHFGDDALIADVRDCSCGVCVCWARRTGTPKNNHAMPASEEHTLHIKTPACTEKTGAQRH